MDQLYPDLNVDDSYSRNARSRTGSSVSTTEALVESFRLCESSAGTPSFETASYTGSSRPPSSRGLESPVYNSPSLPHRSVFLPSRLPHSQPHPHPHHSPFTLTSEGILGASWLDHDRPPQAQGTPLLRVEPAPEELETPASSPPLASAETGAMSAVALPYDPGFSMGSRSFNWPGKAAGSAIFTQTHEHTTYGRQAVEQGNSLLPDLSHHYGSDASLTPPSGSRSVTASPPRSSLTAEQRELKRQRDQARHTSKLQARGRRTGSGSSSVYSPPATLADLSTGVSAMSVHTTAPPPMSLLVEPPTTQYLPSFSPPIPDHSQTSMFQSHYPPPSYMPSEYGYSSAPGPSMPSPYGLVLSDPQNVPTRQANPHASRSMVTDPNLGMYQVPPPMGPGPHDPNGQVRVVTPKPKPQCWEHGCNGRQFSTFSNLLRHQREKSGQAAKATCPNCGAEFTRTTARNGHLLHDKCKQKKAN